MLQVKLPRRPGHPPAPLSQVQKRYLLLLIRKAPDRLVVAGAVASAEVHSYVVRAVAGPHEVSSSIIEAWTGHICVKYEAPLALAAQLAARSQVDTQRGLRCAIRRIARRRSKRVANLPVPASNTQAR
jgi:hypothetical protein